MADDLLSALDRRREEAGRHAENSARLAHAYAQFTTTGQGTQHYSKRIDFGLTFIEKPIVAYGSECDTDELAIVLEVDSEEDPPELPLSSGFVTQWDQDERDFYVGCWIAVKVAYVTTVDLIPADAAPTVSHHFTFSAVAIKDVIPSQDDGDDRWLT